ITSLKQAQESLRRSEDSYRTIYTDAPVGIFSATSDGKLISVNPAFALMMGYDFPVQLMLDSTSNNIVEVLFENPRDRAETVAEALRDSRWRRREMRYKRRDGQIVVAQVMIRSFLPPGAPVRQLEGFVMDITERVRAEAELARQRALMQALMDGIPDHIYFKDAESRFILNSRAHAKELGVGDPAGMLGKNDFDYFPPEFAQKSFSDEQRIMATGEPIIDKIERALWADRPSMWVSSTKMPLRNASGDIIGTFGISRDITERRRMEEKNLRLAAMVDSSSDAIIGLDLATIVTSWNTGAEKTFGYTAQEMIGRPIGSLISSEVLTRQNALKNQLERQGSVQHLESTVTRKDGKALSVSSSFSFVKDPDGEIVGITCISRDMTEQRALQAQIIRAQRLESLGTLAAGIAHQFNNINAVVKGYLDFVVQDKDLAATSRSYIQEALKAVQRSVDITERLQGLTSASGAAWEIMHLEETVPAFLRLLAGEVEKQGITLTVDMQKTSPVRASRSMLGFIITTLVSNAAHALLDRPSPTITVRARTSGDFSALEVSDTGRGIPAEDLPRMFTPFFTTKGEWAEPGSNQVRVKGVGLSLAVCQSSVAESGGWMEVESTPDVGTTFHVWFPVTQAESEPQSGSDPA
ncbi:MAG TPA: PAS domain S-box protein, partial [Spirochaetia bacterium]|nr:PAS domain S-box protein [Spirochaetia bacterium]